MLENSKNLDSVNTGNLGENTGSLGENNLNIFCVHGSQSSCYVTTSTTVYQLCNSFVSSTNSRHHGYFLLTPVGDGIEYKLHKFVPDPDD